MIQIIFKKNEKNKWVSFEITGHAQFAEHGEDIVCAAVSALAITTCNGIEHIAKYQPIIDIEEEFGGYMYVEVLDDLTNDQHYITQTLLENLYLGLCEISKEYPDFVQFQ
ncbi:ribosomal-processing cysteine protease Prp [Granulicatella sp. zg-ZJ]|uniref:ribosomal-processing cysteine protease Prp n=1 Tax=Granulicatella sp. zg-ZJ TaxID=2678504 RepID=UPI0013D372A8|nr:ribosomal-processing cysteine protease Prp [Granulicatella sp. zg-ZJ]NEW63267.1 ribosomal-processing cysteine protease Prp [Granulicatella sp. zg-ZJ]